MPEPLYGTGALVIAEVTAALDDPHLEFIGIRATHKHIHVIVRLDNHSISLTRILYSLVRHTTYIRHYHKLMLSSINGITNSLGGIVRNYKIAYIHSCNLIPGILLEHTAIAADDGCREGVTRKSIMDCLGCIYRLLETLAERTLMTDVVQMVVGHKYG